jgi:putative PIG3 family NAD(P)H quinone oxidoreductase
MRAIVLKGLGDAGTMRVAEVPRPTPRSGELLIKVTAAGVNRADIVQRKGHYPPPAGITDILGMEVSGYVAATGTNVARWKVGDAVCALLAGGGYAEYCVAPQGQVLPVPDGVSLEHAASLPEAAFTVWANLFFDTQPLRTRESLLIQGGSSGIGSFAIQAARSIGARVVATAGSQEKCAYCRDLGAEAAWNYKEENWVAAGWAWSEGKGIQVILDMIGGDYFGKHIELLIVTGSTLRARRPEEKSLLREGVEAKLWPAIANGAIRTTVHARFPLAEAGDAHQLMESSAHLGKIVLTL